MALDLYCNVYNSGARAVQMLAKAIDVELNRKILNLAIGEQLKPEFIKVSRPGELQNSKTRTELL